MILVEHKYQKRNVEICTNGPSLYLFFDPNIDIIVYNRQSGTAQIPSGGTRSTTPPSLSRLATVSAKTSRTAPLISSTRLRTVMSTRSSIMSSGTREKTLPSKDVLHGRVKGDTTLLTVLLSCQYLCTYTFVRGEC